MSDGACRTLHGTCKDRGCCGIVPTVHVHISAIAALVTFFGYVVLLGTLWRLGAAHLVAATSPTANGLGKAMLLQY